MTIITFKQLFTVITEENKEIPFGIAIENVEHMYEKSCSPTVAFGNNKYEAKQKDRRRRLTEKREYSKMYNRHK